MNINIPEKYREEFDKSADFAVEKETFAPSELAEYLGTGVLVASIMVGYMEKAGLVTKGKSDDVRRAKISVEEWEAIGRKIERFEPQPEPEPQVFVSEAEDSTEINIFDIIPNEIQFVGKALCAQEGFITISDKEEKTAIAFEDIATLFLHKGRLFSKSTLTFAPDAQAPVSSAKRADTVVFKKRDYSRIKILSVALAERLGIELVEY